MKPNPPDIPRRNAPRRMTVAAVPGFMARHRYVMGLLLGFVLLGILLHAAYPFPNTHADTQEYVARAQDLKAGVYRPLGYSVLLRLAHAVRPHPTFLFVVQYGLHVLGCIVLLLTVRSAFPWTRPRTGWMVTILVMGSPATLFLTKCLISDSLFISLSHVWLGCLLAYVTGRRPRLMLGALCVLLYLLCSVRYHGLPFVVPTMAAVVRRAPRKRTAWLAAALPALAVALCLLQARVRNQRDLGYDGLAPLGDWALADGVMVAYAESGRLPDVAHDPELQALRDTIEAVAAEHGRDRRSPGRRMLASIWHPQSPLRIYHRRLMQETGASYAEAWTRAGRLYRRFAGAFVRQHPLVYLRCRLGRSLVRFLSPRPEVLAGYTERQPPPHVKRWLGMPGQAFAPRLDVMRRLRAGMHPGWWALGLTVLVAAALLLTGRGTWQDGERTALGVMLLFVAAYAAFQVLAGPTVMRYVCPLRTAQLLTGYLALRAATR